MKIHSEMIRLSTKGYSDIKDITSQVREIVRKSEVTNGLVNVFVIGSTASVSTMEYEPALVEDVREILEKLIPSTMHSRHSQTWGDDNGFSHLRATLMGPCLTAPISEGRVVLGTWQQIVFIDHDNRSRSREIHVQVMGDEKKG